MYLLTPAKDTIPKISDPLGVISKFPCVLFQIICTVEALLYDNNNDVWLVEPYSMMTFHPPVFFPSKLKVRAVGSGAGVAYSVIERQ